MCIFEATDAAEETTAAVERVAHGLSHGVNMLIIRDIVNRVVAVANSIGSCVCKLLGLLCCITETGREPSGTSSRKKVALCMRDTLGRNKQTKETEHESKSRMWESEASDCSHFERVLLSRTLRFRTEMARDSFLFFS